MRVHVQPKRASSGPARDIVRGLDLEADTGCDEGPRTHAPEAEAPGDVPDGVRCGLAPPDGAKNFRDDPPDARRGVASNREQHLDLGRREAARVPPEVPVDLRAEPPVACREPLLGLTRPPVRAIRQGIYAVCTGIDPVRRMGGFPTQRHRLCGTNHDSTSLINARSWPRLAPGGHLLPGGAAHS